MHGMICRCFELFVIATKGPREWKDVAMEAGIDPRGFKSFRHYPNHMLDELFNALEARSGVPRSELLEDVGHWLAQQEAVRRLLRFSGANFTDFITSLDELPARVEMILPDIGLPMIKVKSFSEIEYRVLVENNEPDWTSVLAGLLRAMSDDYGVLSLIVIRSDGGLDISVPDREFSEGRGFELVLDTSPFEGEIWA